MAQVNALWPGRSATRPSPAGRAIADITRART